MDIFYKESLAFTSCQPYDVAARDRDAEIDREPAVVFRTQDIGIFFSLAIGGPCLLPA